MKKQLFFLAVAALALASCSSGNDVAQTPAAQQTSEPGAIAFDAYAQRNTTRAGETGVMDLESLKTSGFGVFAYYTDNNDYEQSRIPDFMYNQLVEWDLSGSYWKYAPIKYWPNEYGDNAISDDNDRVTFFAYAPYVETTGGGKIDKAAGDSWGITGMSRNSAAGDPLVKYIASFEADKSVDLLWGVCDDTNWQITNTGSIQQTINDGKKGLPWKDVQRPQGIDQRMRFTFKHALTQLSVFVDAAVDDFVSTNNELAEGTKIYVRSVSFTGVALKGTLNLNNSDAGESKALWLDYNGTAELASGEPITIYDGLKDGKEGTAGAKASNEKNIGMNPEIISDYGNTRKGVVAATADNGGQPQPLFASYPVMLIPTGEDMEVEIVYDVETKDSKLATLLSDGKTTGSSIENRIKKTISFGENGLENGKHYTLNLHLGMNSVKFDAAVSDWIESYEVRDADLPANMPSFAAASATEDPTTVTISGDNQDYIFAVTGLNPEETVTGQIQGSSTEDALYGKTVSVYSSPELTTADNKANVSGIAYVKVAGLENKTVRNLAAKNYILVQGAESGLAVKLQFDQKASAFQLKVANVANSSTNDEITLESANTSLASNSWIAGDDFDNGWVAANTSSVIKVKKNGNPLNYSATPANAGEFGYADKVITIYGNLSVGDVVEITFNNGEAPSETVVAKIGGLSFVPATRTLTYRHDPYPLEDVKNPTKYGEPGTITWSVPTGGSYASVDSSNGQITTKKINGSNELKIQAKGNATNVAGAEWFYTTSSLTATYDLTINMQATVTSFATDSPAAITNQIKTANVAIQGNLATAFSNVATSKGFETGESTGATIQYSIYSVNGSELTADKNKFTVETTGALKVGGADLAANTTYVVVVKAVSPVVTSLFEASEATYTITITTGN